MAIVLLACATTPAGAGPRSPTEILFIAIAQGDAALVRRSLAAGADPLVRTPSGKTPHALARALGRTEIAEILAAAETRPGSDASIASNPFDPRAPLPAAPPIIGKVRNQIAADPPAPADAPEKMPVAAVVPAPTADEDEFADMPPPTDRDPGPVPAPSGADQAHDSKTADVSAPDPLGNLFRALAEALAPTPHSERATPPAPGPEIAPPPASSLSAPAEAPNPEPEPSAAQASEMATTPQPPPMASLASASDVQEPQPDPMSRLFSSLAAALAPTPEPTSQYQTPVPEPASPAATEASVPAPVEVATNAAPIVDSQDSELPTGISSSITESREARATTPAPAGPVTPPVDSAPSQASSSAELAPPSNEPASVSSRSLFASIAEAFAPTPAPAWQQAGAERPSSRPTELAEAPLTVRVPEPLSPQSPQAMASMPPSSASRPETTSTESTSPPTQVAAVANGSDGPTPDPLQRLIASIAETFAPTPAPDWQKDKPAPTPAVAERAESKAAPTEATMTVAPPLPGPDPEPNYQIGPVTVSLSFASPEPEGSAVPPANSRVATALPPRHEPPADAETESVPKTVDPPPAADQPVAAAVVAALVEEKPAPEPSPFVAPMLKVERHPPLKDARLALGQSATVGRPLAAFGPAAGDCIAKPAWSAAFCVVAVDWPEPISAQFDVRAAEYHGAQAIVRVEGDHVVHYHALFPATSFAAVREYLVSRFGSPTESENPPMPTIRRPSQRNAVSRWRSHGVKDRATVLEVRAHDDLRGYLPDPAYGVVRLYADGARPVFGQLSTADLMLRRMRGTPINVGDVR